MSSADDSLKLPLIALESAWTAGTPARLYSAPADEVWFIVEVVNRIALRLSDESLAPQTRRGLLRLMWGLQRFPIVTPGLSISASWCYLESHCYIEATSESLLFGFCATRLTYFVGSHDLFKFGWTPLYGEQRQQFLQNWASDFWGIADVGNDLHVDDLSTGDLVDRPLMLARHAWIDEDGELDLP